MNEMPTSLSSALGRINKYDGARSPLDGEERKERARKKKRGRRDGGAIFIRDTFYEQNGGAHVRTDIVEIMAQIYRVPINSKIYPPREKKRRKKKKNYNLAVGPKLPD